MDGRTGHETVRPRVRQLNVLGPHISPPHSKRIFIPLFHDRISDDHGTVNFGAMSAGDDSARCAACGCTPSEY
jgi:hypothetical protein